MKNTILLNKVKFIIENKNKLEVFKTKILEEDKNFSDIRRNNFEKRIEMYSSAIKCFEKELTSRLNNLGLFKDIFIKVNLSNSSIHIGGEFIFPDGEKIIFKYDYGKLEYIIKDSEADISINLKY